MTDAEAKLWSRLRGRRLFDTKFRRQVPIGNYIVDFCSREANLVIEVDGAQHAERQTQDERRTRSIAKQGYRVMRFWDDEVLKHIDVVVEQIGSEIVRPKDAPSPYPLPRGKNARERTES